MQNIDIYDTSGGNYQLFISLCDALLSCHDRAGDKFVIPCTCMKVWSSLLSTQKSPVSHEAGLQRSSFLNPFTLRVPIESIVCYFYTFENNLRTKGMFAKYLKESCFVASD